MSDQVRITVNPLSSERINPFADVEETYSAPVPLDPRARDLVIRTIFGEALPKDQEGRAAVANVIRNRVASGRYGQGAEGVIKKPWAFEPWMRPDARARMLGLTPDSPDYQSIAEVVDKIFGGVMPDTTGGSTHFFAPRAQAQLGRSAPAWAAGQPRAAVGGHLFYAPDERGSGTPPASPSRGGAAVPVAAAPPAIQADDRDAMKSLVAQASTKITPGNPFAEAAQPPVVPPTSVAKPALPPQMQTGDIGQGAAFATGVEQGLSFGWSDEVRGLAAALATIPGGGSALDLVRLAWGTYSQDPNAETAKAYNAAVTEARRVLAEAKKQYPGTTLGGEVLGGAAFPLPGGPLTSAGRTVASRVGSSVLQGGIAGGVTGAGSAEGDISKRVGPALIGAGGGAAIGGAVGGLGPTFANYIGGAILDAARPAARAVRKVANLAVDASRLPAKDRILPHQMTPETMVADLLGEPGRGAARAVHNMSDVASSIMKDATEVRASGQYRRLLDWLEGKFGPLGDNEMAKLAVRAEQAQVTTPLYQGVMQQFPSGVMPQRLIALIDQHPTLRGAAEDALRIVRENAALQQRPVPGVDSLEFWDQVKRNIQGKIDFSVTTPGTSASGEQRSLKELQRVIINELDNATGGPKGPYAQARAASEAYFDIGGAIKEGQRFIKSNQFTTPQAENLMRGMSPDAQEAFRKAALSQMLDKFGGVKDSHNLWKGINSSPDAQAKLKFLFNGDQRAIQEFEAMQHVENLHERLREAVRGNSTTVKQYLTAVALGGTGVPLGYLTGNMSLDPTTASGAAAWSGGALATRRFANQQMAEHLATMLVSRDPDIIQRAVRAAAGDVRMMNLLRTMVENAASRTGGAAVGRSIGD
jgi:hypothetical protein